MGVLVITCPATGKDLYWNTDRREGSSRLRYAIEFFASLNTGKKNARRRDSALSSPKHLQSALGSLKDVATRMGDIRSTCREPRRIDWIL